MQGRFFASLRMTTGFRIGSKTGICRMPRTRANADSFAHYCAPIPGSCKEFTQKFLRHFAPTIRNPKLARHALLNNRILERVSDKWSVMGAMPTLAWACFSENFAAWPRKRGQGIRYTKVRCALAHGLHPAGSAIFVITSCWGDSCTVAPERIDPRCGSTTAAPTRDI
jgi:hypothetical protein